MEAYVEAKWQAFLGGELLRTFAEYQAEEDVRKQEARNGTPNIHDGDTPPPACSSSPLLGSWSGSAANTVSDSGPFVVDHASNTSVEQGWMTSGSQWGDHTSTVSGWTGPQQSTSEVGWETPADINAIGDGQVSGNGSASVNQLRPGLSYAAMARGGLSQ